MPHHSLFSVHFMQTNKQTQQGSGEDLVAVRRIHSLCLEVGPPDRVALRLTS